ncbi:hypothetical protein CBER1_00667 [Cercospora berteroae]|uniref:2EXR domain-containing protein n=1 Tax=Cercospora berteroae TaxID=357750 RepID=A0A2S6C995_9PEZI|nr:hypothetical protein CBER1_00667 [Cercospora berteroae]
MLAPPPPQPRLTSPSLRQTSTSPQPNTAPRATFLDLPGELRNYVYRLALRRRGPITIVCSSSSALSSKRTNVKKPDPKQIELNSQQHDLRKGGPALLYVSKEIRREVSEIYYLENTFLFTNATLQLRSIEAFHDQLGRLLKKFNHVQVCRSIQIGDMKRPVEISFSVTLDLQNRRVVLKRKPYDRQVYMPGMAKLKSKYVEPCRCEVDKLAKRVGTPRRMNGQDIITFLEAYSELINMEAVNVMLDICKKCDTICRD